MKIPFASILLVSSFTLAQQAAHAAVPDAVKVPAGHTVMLETVGVGEITYECRDKSNAPGETEWFFVGPWPARHLAGQGRLEGHRHPACRGPCGQRRSALPTGQGESVRG